MRISKILFRKAQSGATRNSRQEGANHRWKGPTVSDMCSVCRIREHVKLIHPRNHFDNWETRADLRVPTDGVGHLEFNAIFSQQTMQECSYLPATYSRSNHGHTAQLAFNYRRTDSDNHQTRGLWFHSLTSSA